MKYKVKITSNPNYCGIGAGSCQFANGECVIENQRMANWFKEHEGYEVTEIEEVTKKEIEAVG